MNNSKVTQFSNLYQNINVLITGHTGFKGSWLSRWLIKLGANVVGYSLPPSTEPNHFSLLDLPIISILGDIRDKGLLNETFQKYKPDIVFHLAAQPLVRRSYIDPVETFETNVIGTINVFEACRNVKSVKAIVNITSDKCYENKEWVWGYRETDPMGGHDPYSASKGCSELLTSSYRRSFFNPKEYGKTHKTLLASVRAGNVIGGGDWAEDRLMPDIVRAVSRGETVAIRYPHAIRPWQHVLEPLSGYLLLGQRLLEGKVDFADAWNFGPDDNSSIPVLEVVEKIKTIWDKVNYSIATEQVQLHEANFLKLDCSKAREILKWKPLWDIKKAISLTTNWYKDFYENGRISTELNLEEYIHTALQNNAVWVSRD